MAPDIGTLPARRDALRGTAPTSERLIGKFYLQAHKHGMVQQFENCLAHVAENFVSADTKILPMCPATFEPLIPHLQMRIKKLDKDQKLGVSLCFILAQGFCSSKLMMLGVLQHCSNA